MAGMDDVVRGNIDAIAAEQAHVRPSPPAGPRGVPGAVVALSCQTPTHRLGRRLSCRGRRCPRRRA